MRRSPKQNSVMKHNFALTPEVGVRRSKFNRSHGHKTTFDGGLLIPVLVDEVLPGDTVNCRMTALARLATPIHPLMDNMKISSFFFFTPSRLVWNNFQKFMGEQEDPGDSTDYTVPVTAPVSWGEDSMGDYMGVPTGVSLQHNALPLRCYNLIYNEWFRDENIQNSRTVDKGDGPDTVAGVYQLQRRGKRFDYFTQALPWPQKGPGVELPLGTVAPVKGIGVLDGSSSFTLGPLQVQESGNAGTATTYGLNDAADMTNFRVHEDPTTAQIPNIYADLTNATAATINELRQAFAIQKLYERDARGGTRYTEILRSHFQVSNNDLRLMRPEYLGGGVTDVGIMEVPQTTSTDATTPQGNLAGVGRAVVNGHGFTKGFTEHGYLIGLVSVQADLTYQQGLDKMWSRSTKHDFYWPAMQSIGEQSLLNQEIYTQGTTADTDVFGYVPRFDEYRFKRSLLSSKMRSSAAATLDAWHLAQNFSALPVLNASFIEDTPPIDRVIAVDTEPHFIADIYFNYICARPMPTHGVPGYIDHF